MHIINGYSERYDRVGHEMIRLNQEKKRKNEINNSDRHIFPILFFPFFADTALLIFGPLVHNLHYKMIV